MLCNFCLSEIEVGATCCPRCNAPYQRHGTSLGIKIRKWAVSGFLMFVSTLMLVDCVLHRLPGGSESSMKAPTAQGPDSPLPDMKGAAVRHLLATWASGKQLDAPTYRTGK